MKRGERPRGEARGDAKRGDRPRSDARGDAKRGDRPRSDARGDAKRGERPRGDARRDAKRGERPRGDARGEPRRGGTRAESAGGAKRDQRGGEQRARERDQPGRGAPRLPGRAGAPQREERAASTRRGAPRLPQREERAASTRRGAPRPPQSEERATAMRRPQVRLKPATPSPRAVPSDRPVRELSAEPHPGHFLLTTRQGSEQDLVEELALLGVLDPPARMIAPAVVLAPKVPKRDKRPVELTFARQGFPVLQSVRAHDLEQIATRVARSLRGQLERARQYALHVFVPDSDLGNPLSAMAEELDARVAAKLAEALPEATRVDDASLRRLASLPLAQVCLLDPERAAAGVTYSNAAISLARGGRTRVRVTGAFPSRAARKLEEALAWLGVEPSAGDLCVDLGAAPGGWTYVLSERRARVIAVDPAQLRPEIAARKGVRHVCESAFTFAPEVEVDWLFCDMAWRPLEAAALLAKWGRKRWARMLVANIKLPMKRKAELIERVRQVLRDEGNWKHVRTKQLYHDRDEITLTAHLG